MALSLPHWLIRLSTDDGSAFSRLRDSQQEDDFLSQTVAIRTTTSAGYTIDGADRPLAIRGNKRDSLSGRERTGCRMESLVKQSPFRRQLLQTMPFDRAVCASCRVWWPAYLQYKQAVHTFYVDRTLQTGLSFILPLFHTL